MGTRTAKRKILYNKLIHLKKILNLIFHTTIRFLYLKIYFTVRNNS